MWKRLYAHSLMPCRLSLYRHMLEAALARGYQVHSVWSFWQAIRSGTLEPGARYLVLRHDVDTSTRAARDMWAVEQALGARATYYFRLATADVALMREIEGSESEVGYHYEEIATLAKERGLASAGEIREAMLEVQQRFTRNLRSLRERSGLPLVTVASHGDFLNVKLNMPNWHLLSDQTLRRQLGIELEAYDAAMLRHVTSRHSDTCYPGLWKQEDPLAAIRRGEKVIHVLAHPEHWGAHPRENLPGDGRRLVEGLCYRWRRRFGRRPSPATLSREMGWRL